MHTTQWRLVGKIIGGAHLKNFIGTISIVNSETGNKINILLKYEHTSIYIFFFYIMFIGDSYLKCLNIGTAITLDICPIYNIIH